MKINYKVSEFIKSAFNKGDHLYDFPQVLFMGKSNVGKSSLINALVEKKNLAYVSKKPGQTKLVNYYLIDHKFYLVDAPGFGYRRLAYEKDNFENMMNDYLSDNHHLKLIVYLLDSRRDITDEEMKTIDYLEQLGYKYTLIFTKCDKLKQSEKAKLLNMCRKYHIDDYLFTSINVPSTIKSLQDKLQTHLF